MKHLRFFALIVILSSLPLRAAVLYVDANSTNLIPPFADWSTAAANIQAAVDAATNGDLILVTNGVYNSGGWSTPNDIFNLQSQVAVDKQVTVQSVNGPAFTTITDQPYFYRVGVP